MKYRIGKAKMYKSLLPQKVRVKKNDMFDQKKMVTKFNGLFANVGHILQKQILESENTFESYLVSYRRLVQCKINQFR